MSNFQQAALENFKDLRGLVNIDNQKALLVFYRINTEADDNEHMMVSDFVDMCMMTTSTNEGS